MQVTLRELTKLASEWINWLCSSVRLPLLFEFNQWWTMMISVLAIQPSMRPTSQDNARKKSACEELLALKRTIQDRCTYVKFYRVCASRFYFWQWLMSFRTHTRLILAKPSLLRYHTCVRESFLGSASKQTAIFRNTTPRTWEVHLKL